MPKEVRLSQCMIVKNEEKNIERALSWGKGVTWEQIVVDTGSTDRTAELAEKCGAKVFRYEWKDDFADAKNYALRQAAGNWVAFLDADEYITPDDTRKLLLLLDEFEQKSSHVPHMVRCRGINLDDGGQPFAYCALDRIFRRTPGLQYEGRVHEQLAFADGRSPLLHDASAKLSIVHTGYARHEMEAKQKARRNIGLLHEEITQNRENIRLQYFLGDAFISAGKPKEARKTFEAILEKPSLGPEDSIYVSMACCQLLRLYFLMRDGEAQRAEDAYTLGIKCDPDNPDIYYRYGCWLTFFKKWREACRQFVTAFAKLESYAGGQVLYMPGELGQAYRLLALSCRQLGNVKDEVRWLVLSLRADRYQDSVLTELLRILSLEDHSADGTLSVVGGIFQLGEKTDREFVESCAKLAGFDKLSERIREAAY